MRTFFTLFLLLVTIYIFGLLGFMNMVPKSRAVPIIKTDAGIAFTGGSGRIQAGLDLLHTGKIEILFISGVHRGVTINKLLHANGLTTHMPNNIILGYQAQDTFENAIESASYINTHAIDSIYLITGAYHMPRAMREMTYRVPNLNIIPYPIHSSSIKTKSWYLFPGTMAIFLEEYTKMLAVILRTSIFPNKNI